MSECTFNWLNSSDFIDGAGIGTNRVIVHNTAALVTDIESRTPPVDCLDVLAKITALDIDAVTVGYELWPFEVFPSPPYPFTSTASFYVISSVIPDSTPVVFQFVGTYNGNPLDITVSGGSFESSYFGVPVSSYGFDALFESVFGNNNSITCTNSESDIQINVIDAGGASNIRLVGPDTTFNKVFAGVTGANWEGYALCLYPECTFVPPPPDPVSFSFRDPRIRLLNFSMPLPFQLINRKK